jgi:hypothetical protein
MARKMIAGAGASTVFPDEPAPSVMTVSPSSGTDAGGTAVRLSMSFATRSTTIKFGGTATTITGASYGEGGYFDVTTPAHAAGPVTIAIFDPVYGVMEMGNGFTFTASAALAKGTASASGGDTAAFLSASAPTGGTAPYTYQWYRSTTNGQKGSSLGASFQDLSETDTGLTNGTTYYYTLDATDSAGSPATVTYDQVSAVPSTSSAGTNEPSGLTQLIYTNGTSKTYTSAVGPATFGGRWLDTTYVEVVTDATNPVGSGSVIEKRMFIGDTSGWLGFQNIQNFAAPWNAGLSEVYMRVRFKYSANYDWHTSAEKLMYFGGKYESAAQSFYIYVADTGAGTARFRMAPQIPSPYAGAHGGAGAYLAGSTTVATGSWGLIEIWMKAQSAPGASDGECKMWINNTLQNHWTARQYYSTSASSCKFDGVQTMLYWGGGGDTKVANDSLRIGEFYFSGKL